MSGKGLAKKSEHRRPATFPMNGFAEGCDPNHINLCGRVRLWLNFAGPGGNMRSPKLISAISKLVQAGEHAGFTLEQDERDAECRRGHRRSAGDDLPSFRAAVDSYGSYHVSIEMGYVGANPRLDIAQQRHLSLPLHRS